MISNGTILIIYVVCSMFLWYDFLYHKFPLTSGPPVSLNSDRRMAMKLTEGAITKPEYIFATAMHAEHLRHVPAFAGQRRGDQPPAPRRADGLCAQPRQYLDRAVAAGDGAGAAGALGQHGKHRQLVIRYVSPCLSRGRASAHRQGVQWLGAG